MTVSQKAIDDLLLYLKVNRLLKRPSSLLPNSLLRVLEESTDSEELKKLQQKHQPFVGILSYEKAVELYEKSIDYDPQDICSVIRCIEVCTHKLEDTTKASKYYQVLKENQGSVGYILRKTTAKFLSKYKEQLDSSLTHQNQNKDLVFTQGEVDEPDDDGDVYLGGESKEADQPIDLT